MLYYSENERTRIAALGFERLEEFVDGVPGSTLERSVLRNLPAVPGFRTGSTLAFKEQKKRLLQRLLSPDAHKSTLRGDWRAFLSVWLLWTERSLESDELKEQLRAAYRSKQDVDIDNVQRQVVEISDVLVREHKVSREVLTSFVEFSPFSTDAFVAVLEKAADQRTLESSRLLGELPERLSSVDSAIEELRSQLREALEDVRAVSKSMKAADDIAQLAASVAAVEQRLERLEHAIGDVTIHQESLSQEVRSVSDRLLQESSLVSDMTSAFSQFEKRSRSEEPVVEELRQRVESLDAKLGNFVTTSASTTSVVSSTQFNAKGELEQLLLTHDAVDETVSVADLNSGSDVLMHLYANLDAIGLSKQSALQVSSELVAAILSGQLIMLAGSLADLLADVFVKSLSAQRNVGASIPLGFSDPRSLAALISTASPPSTLCLRSMNFSSFELYGSPIRTLVLRRQLQSTLDGPLVVGTLASGPLALSVSSATSELGPTIDSDSLSWKLGGKGDVTLGQVQPAAFDQAKLPPVDSELADEVNGAIKESQVQSSELFSRTWRRALQQLLQLGGKDYDESLALDSLFTSWVLPYVTSAGGGQRILSKAFSKFATNGAAGNGRLTKALSIAARSKA